MTIKRQLRCDITVCIYHLQKFSLSSFLLSATASCCQSLPLSISFGAGLVSIHVYGSSKVSGSVALWTCPCFVPACLSASGSLCTFWIYLFGSGSLAPWLQYYPY